MKKWVHMKVEGWAMVRQREYDGWEVVAAYFYKDREYFIMKIEGQRL